MDPKRDVQRLISEETKVFVLGKQCGQNKISFYSGEYHYLHFKTGEKNIFFHAPFYDPLKVNNL